MSKGTDESREAVSRLVGAVLHLDGYAGHVYSPDASRLDIFWCGEQPDGLAATVAELTGDLRGGVRVRAAAFSESDLIRESHRLSREHQNTFPRITVVGPRPDGSGLDVQLADGELARAAQLRVDAGLALESRVPVRVTGEGTPIAN